MKSLSDPLVRTPTVDTEQVTSPPVPVAPAPLLLTLHALRPGMALALTMPALAGLALGWWENGQPLWLWLGFVGVSIFLAALAFLALSAIYDFRQSQTPTAHPAVDLPGTPFALLTSGVLNPGLLLSLSYLFLAISGLCVLWLALLTGWPVIFFSGLGFLLLAASLVPPVRFAFRGWGIGELAVTLGFGLLPLLGAYYVQTRNLNWQPVWAALPLLLLVYLVLLAQNLGSLRRDWRIGKRTLPVLLGGARALDLSVAVTVAAYISLLLIPIFFRLPLWLLGGMATLPLAMGAFGEIRRNDVTPDDGYRVCAAAVKATIWMGILSCAAFWIGRTG